jgi:hypothetical protein
VAFAAEINFDLPATLANISSRILSVSVIFSNSGPIVKQNRACLPQYGRLDGFFIVHVRPNTDESVSLQQCIAEEINLEILQYQVRVPRYCLERNRIIEIYRCLHSCNYRFIDSLLVMVKGSLFLYGVGFKGCHVVKRVVQTGTTHIKYEFRTIGEPILTYCHVTASHRQDTEQRHTRASVHAKKHISGLNSLKSDPHKKHFKLEVYFLYVIERDYGYLDSTCIASNGRMPGE